MEPKYTPYIKPITYDSIALNSAYDFFPDDTRIPYVDVTSESGDLMFFPGHWRHQVTLSMELVLVSVSAQ